MWLSVNVCIFKACKDVYLILHIRWRGGKKQFPENKAVFCSPFPFRDKLVICWKVWNISVILIKFVLQSAEMRCISHWYVNWLCKVFENFDIFGKLKFHTLHQREPLVLPTVLYLNRNKFPAKFKVCEQLRQFKHLYSFFVKLLWNFLNSKEVNGWFPEQIF